jgi:hypothetical protein
VVDDGKLGATAAPNMTVTASIQMAFEELKKKS